MLQNKMQWSSCLPVVLLCSFLTNALQAQLRLPAFPGSLFSTYYHQRVSHFKTLPQTTGNIVFIGNSITDGAEWSELFDDGRIKNRGISGDITAGVMARLDEITSRKPAKVFLMIGVNDLDRNISPESVLKNIFWIASYVKQQTPATSDKELLQDFWIGFNNLSRSPATDSPPLGAWDSKQSTIWVNGWLIDPPHWRRGGQKGNAEIPLMDDGYEYRAPTQILLKRAWNTVLIKAPVESFKGADWQNPVKQNGLCYR